MTNDELHDHRWPVVLDLYDGLRARQLLQGIQVELCDPGDKLAKEAVFFDLVGPESEMDIPVMVGPDKPVVVDETWSLPIITSVRIRKSPEATADRMGVLAAAVLDGIRFCATPHIEAAGVRVFSAKAKHRMDRIVRSPGGAMGISSLHLEIHSRIIRGVTP